MCVAQQPCPAPSHALNPEDGALLMFALLAGCLTGCLTGWLAPLERSSARLPNVAPLHALQGLAAGASKEVKEKLDL